MTAHQPRSRRPRHNDQTRGTAANGSSYGATSFDAVDIATCRLKLTFDGWYLDAADPEAIADPLAAVQGTVPRIEPQQAQPCPVAVIAVVLHHDDRENKDAVQAAADVIRSAVRSLLDPDDLQIKLTVVSSGTGRHG